MILVRPARLSDLGTITEIYNHAVLHGVATFDFEPRNMTDQYAWFNNRDPRYAVLVAVEDDTVVGWSALSPFSHRAGYFATAETASYVHPDHQGKRIGTLLTQALIDTARQHGFHALVGLVEERNVASIHLGEKFGFHIAGRMPEVGHKFGQRLNVVIMYRVL